MSKNAVIYATKYGATERYARWIAEALDAPLFEASAFDTAKSADYDVVVYGGGLYAGGIKGIKLVTKNSCKALVVFTVGLSNPKTANYAAILRMSFNSKLLSKIKVFHLRGSIDYAKLKPIDRLLMTLKVYWTKLTPASKRTAEHRGIVATYGKKIDFTNEQAITPLVEYVQGLGQMEVNNAKSKHSF